MGTTQKEFTGVWLPKEVIEDQELSPLEKMIYAEIACFEVCYMKNEQFADRYGKADRTISRIISKLKDKGYIVEDVFNGRMRGLMVVRDFRKKRKTVHDIVTPMSRQTRQKCLGRVDKNVYAATTKMSTKDNNIDNKEDNNTLCKTKFCEKSKAKAIKKTKKKEPNQTNLILEKFKEVNPNYQQLFPNKTQRSAVDRMLKRFGFEKLARTIEHLPKIISQKYAPRITTPLQLENKMGELICFYRQEQNTKNKLEFISLKENQNVANQNI